MSVNATRTCVRCGAGYVKTRHQGIYRCLDCEGLMRLCVDCGWAQDPSSFEEDGDPICRACIARQLRLYALTPDEEDRLGALVEGWWAVAAEREAEARQEHARHKIYWQRCDRCRTERAERMARTGP